MISNVRQYQMFSYGKWYTYGCVYCTEVNRRAPHAVTSLLKVLMTTRMPLIRVVCFFSVVVVIRRLPARQRTTTWPDDAPCRLLLVPSSQRVASRVQRRPQWRRSQRWCRAVRTNLKVEPLCSLCPLCTLRFHFLSVWEACVVLTSLRSNTAVLSLFQS